MRKALTYTIMLSMMLLMACSSSDEALEGTEPAVQQPTMLTVYVYAPEHPIMTRADVGNVGSTTAESEVKSLQLWIYETTSSNPVGYLSTTETATLNAGQGAVYQIPVPDNFAQNKPNVDVYVLANVKAENCGITSSLTESTTRSALLDNAKIASAKFGLTSLTTAVPGDGLPMAGKLLNQPVVGDAPVLRIGTNSNIATAPLTRAVSKLRFFFANTTGSPTLSITGITLKEQTIPNEEYMFPQAQTLTYNSTTADLLSASIEDVVKKDKPADYVYDGQTAQEYETLITGAGLSMAGPYYLRESDKRLEGTISYSVDNVAQTPVTFKMKDNGDFLRNHSWIVYAYYEGLSGMQVVVVDVTPWEEANDYNEVYNW